MRAVKSRNLEDLKALYLSGLTLRQIGAKLGFSHFKAWWHLRKLEDHTDTVSHVLISRVSAIDKRYATTRTRANLRRLKLDLAVLRQRRPELYADLIERSRPKACQGCARQVAARLRAGMWAWSCGYCGAGGFAKLDLSAAIAAMQQVATSAPK